MKKLILSGEKSVADKWILTRLNETIEHCNKTYLNDMNLVKSVVFFITSFGMISVTGILKWRNFHLYGEDEAAKKTTRSILAYVLDNTMRLLHPFMPFITEEIWQNLPHEGESITVATWPVKDAVINRCYKQQKK